MTDRSRKTIKDVARAAGVSIGTASRALNRTGRVSEATVIKVSKAAQQLGNAGDRHFAGCLARGRLPRV